MVWEVHITGFISYCIVFKRTVSFAYMENTENMQKFWNSSYLGLYFDQRAFFIGSFTSILDKMEWAEKPFHATVLSDPRPISTYAILPISFGSHYIIL